MLNRLDVAVLGATGMVGQRFVQLLHAHPRFRVVALCASDRSVGKRYGDAAVWRLEGTPLLQEEVVLPCDPSVVGPKIVFSALDKGAAVEIEPLFAAAGCRVISNASAFRMNSDVPLLIPEVNPDHARVLDGRKGYIVTNPNCTCIPMVVALAPLQRAFGIRRVCCASYQAVSGAGYPGESAWDILGNVRPHPGDEELKVAEEPNKILGQFFDGQFVSANIPISARCVRVPVADGHLIAVQAELAVSASVAEVQEAMRTFVPAVPLPSSPVPLIRVLDGRDRPQPRLDAMAGNGMAIVVGRVEPCEVFTVKFFALAHNAIRGAAGGAIANAELLDAWGLL